MPHAGLKKQENPFPMTIFTVPPAMSKKRGEEFAEPRAIDK
jgi:hypothetical protein